MHRRSESMKLIIADDEAFIRRGIASLDWAGIGVEVIGVAKNGMQVLELIREEKPDVLLTDIKMPGMSGLELTREVEKLCPDMPVILLTGYDEFAYAQEAVKLGIFDYILKPSNPTEILECVKRALQKVKENQQAKDEMQSMKKELENTKRLQDVGQMISTSSDVGGEEPEELIQTILTYLREHYAENITLEVLAAQTHFHTGYLSRYIKQKTGQNYLAILTDIRIHHAAQLLLETNLKNYEIGERVGIPGERYFGQVFKKAYGVTPSQYRKNKRKQDANA